MPFIGTSLSYVPPALFRDAESEDILTRDFAVDEKGAGVRPVPLPDFA